MKKTATVLTALVLAGGLATPALADITATASIDKTDNVTVNEQISITKQADILVVMGASVTTNSDGFLEITPLALAGAAEADALANVTNTENTSGPDFLVNTNQSPTNNRYVATISSSVTGNQGITQVNQDVGNNTNQGNNVALAYTEVPQSFADAQAGGDQSNTNNFASNWAVSPLPSDLTPGVDPTTLPNSDFSQIALIDGSINSNIGIVGVNQNAGDMNNQTNEVAAAIGVNPQLAMAEGALGQVNSGNFVKAANTVKYDEINGSVTGNQGVVNVNQSTGNMNNQMSSFAIAAAVNSDATVRSLIGSPTQ